VAPRFKVFIETNRRIGGPGGWLTVYQGLLILDASKTTSRIEGFTRLQQSTPTVRWIRQPLFPPWINRAIDFVPDSSPDRLRLRFTFGMRNRLHATLLAGGFDVVEETSWSLLFGP
jgi:hypothetical protein